MSASAKSMTIPEIAQQEAVSVDWLRKLLRRREHLQVYLQRLGPTRVVPGDRVREFVDAIRSASTGG